MSYKTVIVMTLISLAAVRPTPVRAFPQNPQDDTARPETTVTIHLKISAEGMDRLPAGSTIELKGDPATCKEVRRTQNIQSGEATLPDIPKCKIDLRFLITGFDTQVLTVDFGDYTDPLQILIKSDGAHIVPLAP
jgi:hypothetical protein